MMEFQQIVTDGGAGDLICELVAVNWNIIHHPNIYFHVWVPDYLLTLAKHLITKPNCIIWPFSKEKEKFNRSIEGMTTMWVSNHTPMRTHPVDYGFHMLSDRHIYERSQKCYLQIRPEEIKLHKFKLPKRYAVMQATFAEPVKTMPIETFNAVTNWLIEHDICPIYLGKEVSHAGFKDLTVKGNITEGDLSKGLNFINKTDLLEAAGIIANSCMFIGMDGGLTHLAGCTRTFIVSGYTLVDPIHVEPIRDPSNFVAIEPDLDIPNRYYQTWHSGFKKGDFRKFEGWEKVVASMTKEKFIGALNENCICHN